MYAEEKKKPTGLSSPDVMKAVKNEYGVAPSDSTIRKYVREGRAGESPSKLGKKGSIEETTFKTLCTGFESYIRILQINGRGGDITRNKLAFKLNKLMNMESPKSFMLLNRLLKETAVDLLAARLNSVEDRRILWTTHRNLRLWFDNWTRDLEELGFAKRNEKAEVYIPDEQLGNIANLDETCMSLDGSNGNRGGRPEVTFFDPRFPQLGKGTSKSSLTTTMIAGSTAAGEPLPPHFQFQTAAQSIETEKLRMQLVGFMKSVRGKYGTDEERIWPTTFGMNEKGGMDDDEFAKFLNNSIIPLWPKADDIKGMRVMLKLDSGPGRTCVRLLAQLRMLGFYLYPGVPNTTAVTQETDRNYGPFKTQFRKNLDLVVQDRQKDNESKAASLQPWLVGLVIFGGVDPETGREVVCIDAFAFGFSVVRNLDAWSKIGAAPLTMACLSDSKVRREIGDAEDDTNLLMIALQQANDLASQTLTMWGYDGDILKVEVRMMKERKLVTVRHSRERIELLAKASTHGAKFCATHGEHLTSDDMFKACEVPVMEAEVKRMVQMKELRLLWQKNEEEAKQLLVVGKALANYLAPELGTLLTWYQVPATKMGNKPERVRRWKAILEAEAAGRVAGPFEDDESHITYSPPVYMKRT